MTSSRNIKCPPQHFPIVDCHTSTNPEQCQPAAHATGLHLYFITPALQQAQGIVTYANSANCRHEGLLATHTMCPTPTHVSYTNTSHDSTNCLSKNKTCRHCQTYRSNHGQKHCRPQGCSQSTCLNIHHSPSPISCQALLQRALVCNRDTLTTSSTCSAEAVQTILQNPEPKFIKHESCCSTLLPGHRNTYHCTNPA